MTPINVESIPETTNIMPNTNANSILNSFVPEAQMANLSLDDNFTNTAYQPENTISRRRLIIRISQYKLQFGKYLNEIMAHKNLEMMEENDLNMLLEEIKLIISTKGCNNTISTMYFSGLYLVENIAPQFIGVPLPNLTATASQSEDINDT